MAFQASLSILLMISLLVPSLCQGAPGSFYEQEESQIPKHPSIPPQLAQKAPENFPHCARFFLYQGKKYECDSNRGGDAEMLRPIVADVPEAVAELDVYQKNRQKMKVTGYIGSVGVLGLISGILISHPATDPETGRLKPGGYVMIGSLGLAAAAVIIGLRTLKSNEEHIGNAVRLYNTAYPDRPVDLQFSTQINF